MTTVIPLATFSRYGPPLMLTLGSPRPSPSPSPSSRPSFALDVAAPSLRRDPDAPWTGAPVAHREAGLATAFWVSFHGLSVLIHSVLLALSIAGPMFLAVVPIPFLAAMCVEVHPVMKPIERVEMAIVELPPEPPKPEPTSPEPTSPEVVTSDDGKMVKPKKKAKLSPREALLRDEVASAGVLALLSSQPSEHSALFGSLSASSDNALGGLIGTQVGDSLAVGGLGLRGLAGSAGSAGAADVGGLGGGLVGTGEGTIGLGSIGSLGTVGRGGGTGSGYGTGAGRLGRGKKGDADGDMRVNVSFGAMNAAQRGRVARALAMCRLTLTQSMSGTIVVENGVAVRGTIDAEGSAASCALRWLKRGPFENDGTFAFTLSR